MINKARLAHRTLDKITRITPNTCSCFRLSARGPSNAQNSQLWSPGGLPPAVVHIHFAGVQQSVWDYQALAHSSIGALDRGWHLACALPRPMYRITCPSRARLHARSEVIARHRCLTYRIIGHYPMGLSAARDHRASKGPTSPSTNRSLHYPGRSDDDVDVRALLCTGPVGREEARPCAAGQPP